MTTNTFFFDSYALLEMVYENPVYAAYKDKNAITTKLNAFEVYTACLRDHGQAYADRVLAGLTQTIVDFDLNVVANAAMLRNQFSRQRLSMTDVIGYTLSLQKNVRFLTGDQQFKDLPNVEYVK